MEFVRMNWLLAWRFTIAPLANGEDRLSKEQASIVILLLSKSIKMDSWLELELEDIYKLLLIDEELIRIEFDEKRDKITPENNMNCEAIILICWLLLCVDIIKAEFIEENWQLLICRAFPPGIE